MASSNQDTTSASASASTTTSPPRPHLFALPATIQQRIVDYLDWPTLQVLHATHPNFRQFLDQEKLKGVQAATTDADRNTNAFLLQQLVMAACSDPFFRPRELRACCSCFRLRSSRSFEETISFMRLDGQGPQLAASRCLDCARS